MKRHAFLISLLFLTACSKTPAPQPEGKPQPAPVAQASAPAPAPAAATPPARVSKPPAAAKPSVAKPVVVHPAPPSTPAPVPERLPEPLPPQVVTSRPVALPEPPPPAPVEPAFHKVVIPPGTLINVRLIDSINSDTDHVGQAFKASMVSPVMLENETVIPRNADVYVKLVAVKAAGNMTGTSELRVQLDRIFIDKKSYVVESNTYVQTGASQTQKTAKTIGIGTAIGAAIGAIGGGRKGAVIGAGAGAGAGTAVEAATKGEQVRIASESPLTFRLESPVEVTLPVKP